ncbi:MAG: NAD-binding protein [Coprothermobacterota bacterium]|nr:NAD-binding protein [Coprothermobacterota bacterium]
MKILIIGCGRLGGVMAEYLEEDGNDVTVVDKRSTAFRLLLPTFRGKTILGNGIDQDILREAGAEGADLMIVASDSDNTNIMAALVGQRIFHIPRIMARIYHQSRISSYQEYGMETYCPTALVAGMMRESIKKGA